MLRALAIAGAVLAAASAAAQTGGPPAIPLFISPAGEPFRIDPGEPYPLVAWFAKADADTDGALSPDEFRTDALRFFEVLDSNHDGRVAGVEVGVYEREMAPEILRRGPPVRQVEEDRRAILTTRSDKRPDRSVVPPPLREGAGLYGLLNEPQPVTGADLDLNGLIMRDEWSKAADRRFGLLDADGDGRLTLPELPRTPVQSLLVYAQPD